jgi:hypothetical protein
MGIGIDIPFLPKYLAILGNLGQRTGAHPHFRAPGAQLAQNEPLTWLKTHAHTAQEKLITHSRIEKQ